jgi:hypothetical protein
MKRHAVQKVVLSTQQALPWPGCVPQIFVAETGADSSKRGAAICAISCEGPWREVQDRKARHMPEEAGRRKKFTRVVAILAFAFLAMQFVRPARWSCYRSVPL